MNHEALSNDGLYILPSSRDQKLFNDVNFEWLTLIPWVVDMKLAGYLSTSMPLLE